MREELSGTPRHTKRSRYRCSLPGLWRGSRDFVARSPKFHASAVAPLGSGCQRSLAQRRTRKKKTTCELFFWFRDVAQDLKNEVMQEDRRPFRSFHKWGRVAQALLPVRFSRGPEARHCRGLDTPGLKSLDELKIAHVFVAQDVAILIERARLPPERRIGDLDERRRR